MKKKPIRPLPIADFAIGEGLPLVLISGPCVIESEELAMRSAERLKEILRSLWNSADLQIELRQGQPLFDLFIPGPGHR